MDVVGRIVTEGEQVVVAQDLHDLREHGALAPGPAGLDLVLTEAAGLRRFPPNVEFRHVLQREQTSLLPKKRDEFLRDLAAIEELACRGDTCLSTAS